MRQFIRRNELKKLKELSKMEKNITLTKVTKPVNLEFVDRNTGESTWKPVDQSLRDDGQSLVSLLGQIDWGSSKFRKYRDQCGKFMSVLRDFNIEHATDVDYEEDVTIPMIVAKVLYDALQKDDVLRIIGTSMLETVQGFEDWYRQVKE